MRKTAPKVLRNSLGQPEPPAPPPPSRPAFGRGQRHAPVAEDLDRTALRDGGTPPPETRPRWLLPAGAACAVFVLLGGVYFIHVMLGFQKALQTSATSFEGPYPSSAVLLFALPLFCALGYFLLDYIHLKTGIAPFTTPKGLGVTAGVGLLMLLLLQLSGLLLRHMDDAFAARYGYAWCSSPFDPGPPACLHAAILHHLLRLPHYQPTAVAPQLGRRTAPGSCAPMK